MSESGSTDRGRQARSIWNSRTATTAVFVALAAAMGFLLISVPNVELLTFTVFAAGVVLGRWRGALVGLLAMGIHSGANPYGSGLGIPTLFAAQLGASALSGFAGGSVRRLWTGRGPGSHGRTRLAVASGILGLGLTAVYQAAVIVGIASMSPEFRTSAFAVIIANAFFSSIHLASNTVLFAVLAPTVLPRVLELAGAPGAPAGGTRASLRGSGERPSDGATQ